MSGRPDLEKLHAAAREARALATRCFGAETTGVCWNVRHNPETLPCCDRESKRLKGEPTLPRDAIFRAYSMFNPEKLCGACLAYWHMEMGAQALEHLAVQEERIHAEEERKQK